MINKSDVYTGLAEKLNYPPSEHLLRILEKMITLEEGILLLELPGKPDELAEKAAMDEEKVNSTLKEFLRRGLVVTTKKGPRLVRDVMQLHDASLASSQEYIDEELLNLWKEFYEKEWCKALSEHWRTIEQPMCEVIPVWKSILEHSQISSSEILPKENMNEIIKGAEYIAVVPCPCRRALRRCDTPLEICMQFNKWAEYAVNRGAGRKISIEEALSINDLAEGKGLVHIQPIITPTLSLICNCCADCCALLDPCIKYGGMDKALAKSRYRAGINYDSCTECNLCIDICPFGAIEVKDSSASKEPIVAVDPEKCFGCGVCTGECPTEAITMKYA